ncbi:MAG: hypothetical protein COA77_11120 [Thaumarchaeota archaeon]|nr:MAG: hypothetical protein COA77_11120 [Nitrososphaerota archaeon]
MVCKGICTQHKAQKVHGEGRYTQGQKMCSVCAIFIYWGGKHCPCCNFALRTNPRNTKNRRELQIIQTVKRI